MSETIFEALRNDHRAARTLLSILTDTNGPSEGRKGVFRRLKEEVQTHAAAEERVLYRPLLEFDNTQPKSRHSMAEHEKIDDLLSDLEDKDMSSPGWLILAKKLEETLLHHMDEEEHQFFKSAGHALDESKKHDLANEYHREKERLTN